MAEGFFSRLFGLDDDDSERENQTEGTKETNISETTETTLQDVVNFVAELQSYYFNDICKMQTDLLVDNNFTQSKINFINKKIKQEQVALSQIEEILDLVRKKEREYQSVFGKSVYSFYDEIEDAKLETVQAEVFEILIKLFEVNTKPELNKIISKRIKTYCNAWKITTQIEIPKNYNAIIVDEEDGIEEYHFGDFCKNVYAKNDEKTLSASQLDKIRALKFEFENTIPTNEVWVYASSTTRMHLNFMRQTCILPNDWEYTEEENSNICFDIVKTEELEEYLKGILQILLKRRTHAVISIIIPTNDMLRALHPTKRNGNKAEICKKYRFQFKQRSGLYKENLLTTRVDRRNIPEKLNFVSYLNFKKINF